MSLVDPVQTIGPEPVRGPDVIPSIPPPAGTPDAPTSAEQEMFDRAYVEGLRKEAAGYRTRARDYEQAFDGYDDETKAGWLELVSLAKSAEGDPELQAQLAELLGFQLPPTEPTAPSADALTPDAVRQMARAEAQAILNAERQSRTEADTIREVQSTAKGLGYDPESPDYVLLLQFANRMDTPDLATADAQVKAWKQEQFDAFLATKSGQAAQSPVSPSGNGSAPSLAQTPKTWAELRNSLRARLDAMPGQ